MARIRNTCESNDNLGSWKRENSATCHLLPYLPSEIFSMFANLNPILYLQEFRCLSSSNFSICLHKSHPPFQAWMHGCWNNVNANREWTRPWIHRVSTPKHRYTELWGSHNWSNDSWWTKLELKFQECSIPTAGLGFQLTVRKWPGSGRAGVQTLQSTPDFRSSAVILFHHWPWTSRSGNMLRERDLHGIWQTRIVNLTLSG